MVPYFEERSLDMFPVFISLPEQSSGRAIGLPPWLGLVLVSALAKC